MNPGQLCGPIGSSQLIDTSRQTPAKIAIDTPPGKRNTVAHLSGCRDGFATVTARLIAFLPIGDKASYHYLTKRNEPARR